MNIIRSFASLLLIVAISVPVHAGWRTLTGKIDGVSVYEAQPIIVFSLDVQASVPPVAGCANSFAVDPALPSEIRQYFLSQITSALMSQKPVIVTWVDDGSCVQYDSTTSFLRTVRITVLR